MKLIYAAGACSFSVHLMLEELGIPYEAIKVSLKDKTVLDSYTSRSYVPVLVLEDGQVMTEAISILMFLSAQNDDAFMPIGHMGRAKCIEWLSFISSELHKGVAPLFHLDGLMPDYLEEVNKRIDQRFRTLDERLIERTYIMGEDYTIADMYCLAILRIAEHVKVQLDQYPNVTRYKEMLEARPVVQKVSEDEKSAKPETRPRTLLPVNNGSEPRMQLY